MRPGLFFSAVLFLCVLPLAALQSNWRPKDRGLDLGGAQPQVRGWVHLDSATRVTVPAGQTPHPITLKFLINNGLHINSHTPHSAWLVPTNLTLDAPAGMHITTMEFPQGVDHHFHFAPKEAMNVYTGEFTVIARVLAAPGTYPVQGKLRYQSCDNEECNPPKTLPFTLQVIAR